MLLLFGVPQMTSRCKSPLTSRYKIPTPDDGFALGQLPQAIICQSCNIYLQSSPQLLIDMRKPYIRPCICYIVYLHQNQLSGRKGTKMTDNRSVLITATFDSPKTRSAREAYEKYVQETKDWHAEYEEELQRRKKMTEELDYKERVQEWQRQKLETCQRKLLVQQGKREMKIIYSFSFGMARGVLCHLPCC